MLRFWQDATCAAYDLERPTRIDPFFALRYTQMLCNIRFAARMLLKSPVFTAVAVLSLVDQILLRLLPVQDPMQLVQLKAEGGGVGSQTSDGQHTFSYPI